MTPNRFSCFARDYSRKRIRGCYLNVSQAPEMREKPLPCKLAHSRDVQELRIPVSHCPPLPMIADCEAMALVPDHLNEMQYRGTTVENHWLVLVAVQVDHFFLFGDGCERLGREAQSFQ